MVVATLGALLGRPSYDIGVALYGTVPSATRWALGEGVFLLVVAAGLARLVTVKPSDRWPIPPTRSSAEPGSDASWWAPWAMRLAVASLIIPIMRHSGGLGFADWDFVLDKFEAVRRTILALRTVSLVEPLVTRRLSTGRRAPDRRRFDRDPFCPGMRNVDRPADLDDPVPPDRGRRGLPSCVAVAPRALGAAAAALVYGASGAILVEAAQGYVAVMSYCSVPWLLYHGFRLGDRFFDGLALGFWLAFAVLNGVHYLTLYGGLLMTAIVVRAFRVLPLPDRKRALIHAVAAVGVFLAIAGWRLATIYPVLRDDRREPMTRWDESLNSAFAHLLERPVSDWTTTLGGWDFAVYSGLVSYVGPVIVMLALASLYWGWRWWHILSLIAGWLAIGSIHWYHASYWLGSWPFFSSAHVVTRWRYLAILGIGLAAGSVLARWRRSNDRRIRVFAVCLTIMVAADFVSLAYQQLPIAFSIRPDSQFFPGPPVATIVNVREGLGYPCVLRGYGVIRGYEPMLSYRRDAFTLRKPREDADYRGESWTTDGPVEPAYWSPNRIVFQVAPRQVVCVNQNPGSWWWANGRTSLPGPAVCGTECSVCCPRRRERPASSSRSIPSVSKPESRYTFWEVA